MNDEAEDSMSEEILMLKRVSRVIVVVAVVGIVARQLAGAGCWWFGFESMNDK